ncbi:hypothetical protein Lfu02_02810 [Longispora fulva]|uniref:YCII-related domain-containing protein n=1 Tax=Longispora fulva TaxID=619741 RepID=A0A8J7GFW1_9ACTN|nr:YciI family protein [Longispora fulva]MBG6135847.1 hypothetical protein [Longispora fulva]GIG55909.1 hypothetical protein Lfu02_02810 [Longispora fulva]
MAKYLILIYGDEQRWQAMTTEEERHLARGHNAFLARAGDAIVGGGQLEGTAMATSLRAGAEGRPAITDGPFLETKEVIGGFYLLDAPDLDAAIALARTLPEVSVDHSGVEVRPLYGTD